MILELLRILGGTQELGNKLWPLNEPITTLLPYFNPLKVGYLNHDVITPGYLKAGCPLGTLVTFVMMAITRSLDGEVPICGCNAAYICNITTCQGILMIWYSKVMQDFAHPP